MPKIVIGTRATRLAQIEAQEVVEALRAAAADVEAEVKALEGEGPGRLEEALLAKEIDLAVHSARDLPTNLAEGLAIGAFTKRRAVEDALIAKGGEATIDALPAGAKIGAAGARQRVLILEKRKDLEILPAESDVEARLAKVDAGELDAAIAAVADLQRLGLQGKITAKLDEDFFIPPAGQGALALEVRAGELAEVCQALDHATTRIELECERAFLQACETDGAAPVGVRGMIVENEVFVKGIIAEQDGAVHFRSGRSGPRTMAKLNGKMLAQMMLAMGGKQVLEKWRATQAQAEG